MILFAISAKVQCVVRGIAQSGSAPALGAGCRGFKSLYPDQLTIKVRCDKVLLDPLSFKARWEEEEHRRL